MQETGWRGVASGKHATLGFALTEAVDGEGRQLLDGRRLDADARQLGAILFHVAEASQHGPHIFAVGHRELTHEFPRTQWVLCENKSSSDTLDKLVMTKGV
jgi:hypothetical protein